MIKTTLLRAIRAKQQIVRFRSEFVVNQSAAIPSARTKNSVTASPGNWIITLFSTIRDFLHDDLFSCILIVGGPVLYCPIFGTI